MAIDDSIYVRIPDSTGQDSDTCSVTSSEAVQVTRALLRITGWTERSGSTVAGGIPPRNPIGTMAGTSADFGSEQFRSRSSSGLRGRYQSRGPRVR
jgi:hypothetical protein